LKRGPIFCHLVHALWCVLDAGAVTCYDKNIKLFLGENAWTEIAKTPLKIIIFERLKYRSTRAFKNIDFQTHFQFALNMFLS